MASDQLRVLLAESHAETARLLVRLLSHHGFRASAVGTMEAAARASQAEAFDVLVNCVGLPDGNGYELLARLRADGRPALRGIILSGYGMAEDLLRSQQAGYDEHVVKPMQWPALRETIERVGRAAGGAAAGRAPATEG